MNTNLKITAVLLAFVGVTLFIIDVYYGHTQLINGRILDKQYSAEKTSMGTGVNTSGKVGIITVHAPEKFLFITRADNGIIRTIECDPAEYYSKNKGKSIVFMVKKGRITNITWSTEIYKSEE